MPRIERFFASSQVSDWTSRAFGAGGAAADPITATVPAPATTTNPYTDPAGQAWVAVKYTASGTFVVDSGEGEVQVFAVGGGGGGGGINTNSNGAGAGGGGVRQLPGGVYLTAGTYPVTVGAGGSAGASHPSPSSNPTRGGLGATTTFAGVQATGGGGGGGGQVAEPTGETTFWMTSGQNGACGGGSCPPSGLNPRYIGTGTTGGNGGAGRGAWNGGGGGAGGTPGTDGADPAPATNCAGGDGVVDTFYEGPGGTPATYGGGGGGSRGSPPNSPGGAGGGGPGGYDQYSSPAIGGTAGTANTGGGGGGSASGPTPGAPTGTGGAGGSGTVILRYKA